MTIQLKVNRMELVTLRNLLVDVCDDPILKNIATQVDQLHQEADKKSRFGQLSVIKP